MKGLAAHLEELSGKFCLVISIEVTVANVREAEMVSVGLRGKKQQEAVKGKVKKIIKIHAENKKTK